MRIDDRWKVAGTASALLAMSWAPGAEAGKLYQLKYQWEGPVPALPATIEVHVFKDAADLRGTSSEVFNGNGDIPSHTCDAVVCLTDTRILGGQLRVTFLASGYNQGRFAANSSFEVVVNGSSSRIAQHTSCSQPIPLGIPLSGDPFGVFTITGGAGSCVPGAPGCPDGPKAFEIHGEFRISLATCTPGEIAFHVYKDLTGLQGTSTATFTGGGLTNIVCDDVACLTGAIVDGDTLMVSFETFGYQPSGAFGANTSWEMDLGACGTFQTAPIHTSCSQAFLLDVPQPAGEGEFIFTDGCGACLVHAPVSVEKTTWGGVKGRYRE